MPPTVDEDEKVTHRISTLTNSYSALFLTEDGLYEVLMQSRKPITKNVTGQRSKKSTFESESRIVKGVGEMPTPLKIIKLKKGDFSMENKNLAVSVFTNEEFGNVRTVVKDEEVWFVAKDICDALGYSNSRDAIRNHVFDVDKADVGIFDGRQKRVMTIINEGGIYALIFGSKKESAKRFRQWVFEEVLPTIRKHGAYISENADVEYVNNELKFSEKRTINSFANCKSIDEAEKLYEDFRAYVDKEYKNDSKTRIARYKSVEKGLNRLHKNLAQDDDNIGKCHSVKVLLIKVITDRTTLEKRVSGGIRADLKKKLQSASQTTIQ